MRAGETGLMLQRRLSWMESAWVRLPPLAARGVHALLLHGARGIGKKNLALDFAEALLCAAPLDDGHACGHCGECRLAAAGNHPDFRWVLPQALAEQLLPQAEGDDRSPVEDAPAEPDSNGKPARASREIRVEQIRALSDFLGIAAHRGGRRVVVLAPAEAMNAIAANTVLKMLEEPPASAVFVLVADALDDVLPTIRSRCVLVQVPVPAAAACQHWLQEQGIADPAAALALASGAPLAAVAETGPDVLAPEVANALYRMLERGPELTAAQVATGVGRDPAIPACLRLLQCWAFDLLQYRSRASVRYHPQREGRIRDLAAKANPGALWRWIDVLRDASAVRDHPLNPRLVIESALTGYLEVFDDRR
jgi:DNA polymerase-3 subunit delta'